MYSQFMMHGQENIKSLNIALFALKIWKLLHNFWKMS